MRQGKAIAAIVAAGLLAGLGGCQSAASGEGNVLRNLLLYGGTTVPPAAPDQAEEAYCPAVDILDGGAALRAVSGESVRHQISIGQVARECAVRPDGSVLVKVGVEGRVLLGAGGGSGGRFEAPVRFVIKRGEATVASRVRRVAVAIPSGETQAAFTVVEDGLVVPPQYARDYEILVGLGGAQAERSARRARR